MIPPNNGTHRNSMIPPNNVTHETRTVFTGHSFKTELRRKGGCKSQTSPSTSTSDDKAKITAGYSGGPSRLTLAFGSFLQGIGLKVLRELLYTTTAPTPGPVKQGELFYRTRQGANSTCGKHALDAFIGKPSVSLDQMRTAADALLAPQRELARICLTPWEKFKALFTGVPGVPGQGKYRGFETNTIQSVLRQKGYHTESHRIDMPKSISLASPTVERPLNDTEKAFLNDYEKKTGISSEKVFGDENSLKEASKAFARWALEPSLESITRRLENVDRCMVNCGNEMRSHWVAFRKDLSGNWHLLDSLLPIEEQPVIHPRDYLLQARSEGKSFVELVLLRDPKIMEPKALAEFLKEIGGHFGSGRWPDYASVSKKDLDGALRGIESEIQGGKPVQDRGHLEILEKYIREMESDRAMGQDQINPLSDIHASYLNYIDRAGSVVKN